MQFTELYAAPEFDNSSSSTAFHNSDVWALGVIVFELFHKKWNSPVQRAKDLLKFKKNGKNYEINDFEGEDQEIINKIVKNCIKINPKDRMSIEEISSLFKTKVLNK